MEATLKRVYEIFNKTEEAADEDVKIVSKWLLTQPHLPEIMEEAKVRNFLILNKFSIEKTKQRIDMYYTIRDLIPDFYNDFNPNTPHFKRILETMYLGLYPAMVQDTYNVFFYVFKEPNILATREMATMAFNITEIRLCEGCTFGDIHVLDMTNLTLSDIMKVTPSVLVKIVAIYEKVLSLRVKSMYVLNAAPYVSRVLAILKLVLKPKIFNRIHLCQNTEILKELFTEETLPRDYGGRGPSLQEMTDTTRRKFEEYRDRFDLLDKMRVDERLRPQKLNNDDILGFYGNFKKLNVD